MREVMKFDNGLRWVLVETSEEAALASKMTGMSVSAGFDVDQREGLESKYYILTDEKTGSGHVMVRDGKDRIMFTAPDGKLVWGNTFSHPWPEFGDEIAELAKGIGIELGPEHCPTALRPAGPGM